MNWLKRLMNRQRMDEQLEKEIGFHLDTLTEDLIAQGADPVEARRQARLAFGGRSQVTESARDARGTTCATRCARCASGRDSPWWRW
jgi:hypothetical protein